MYAVIKTGGKQERVEQGQTLAVERLGAAEGTSVTFAPVMLVDGDTVLAGAGVAGSLVEARVVGESKGPKIRGFTYKNKSRGRKSWGHRQHYTTIEITGITATSTSATSTSATSTSSDSATSDSATSAGDEV